MGAKPSVPAVPSSRKPDPEVNVKMLAEIAPLEDLKTVSGFTHCERKKSLWLWIRKSSNIDSESGSNAVRVDLENFDRSRREKKDQGRVLYTATFSAAPTASEVQQITASHRNDALLDTLEAAPEESLSFYLNHLSHLLALTDSQGTAHYHRPLDPCLLSKWTATFQISLTDGDLGRGKDFISSDKPLVLQIYATGVVVTSYFETKYVKYKQTVNKITRDVEVVETHKAETRLVDTLNYRLFSGEEMIAEWNAEGDTYARRSADVVLDNTLFSARLQGGWLDRYATRVSTKPESEVDSALAFLIAHLVSNEFSVQEIKQYVKIDTPNKPPEEKKKPIDPSEIFGVVKSSFQGANPTVDFAGCNTLDDLLEQMQS